MRKPCIIGECEFPTKSAAKDCIRKLVNRYKDGERILGFDHLFLCDLVALHPESIEKIGCGIEKFTVRLDPEWQKTRGFILHRINGTSTDFSWVACIDGRSRRADVLSGLRHAIVDQVLEAKSRQLEVGAVCPYRGITLDSSNCHVGHMPPNTFANLVAGWMNEQRLSFETIEISPSVDNQYFTTMTNRHQVMSWQGFHRLHASLRLVSKRANLSDVKRS